MPQYTTSLGGGMSDVGTSFILSFGSSTDVTSAWNPINTNYSGAFDSTGITGSTVRPARVSRLRLRLGGTYSGYSGNADVILQLATDADGGGGYNDDTTYNQTGTTGNASTGTVDWAIDTATTYYYGARGTTGTGSVFFFARGGSGNVYKDGVSVADFAGDSLSGDIVFQTIPSAPGAPVASNEASTSLTLTWTAPTDDGIQADPGGYSAGNINGYRINYRVTGTSAWSVLVANTGSNLLTTNITSGLNRNTSYDFQVAALNDVTDSHNTDYSLITAHVGVRSSTGTATTLAGGPKVWNGTTMSQSEIKVWNGTSWVTGGTMKVWNGSGWSNIT